MKKVYRLTAILLIFACLAGDMTGVKAEASQGIWEEAQTVELSEQTEMTWEPEDTALPEETSAPETTPMPTDTAEPTNTPEPTGTPIPTGTPGPTNTPKPTQTPKPELEVQLSQKKKKLTIRWNKLENAKAYLLYSKVKGSAFRKTTIKNKYKTVLTLEYGKTYVIQMAARGKNKILSKTTKYEIYIPRKVGTVRTISQGKNSVKLTWGGVSGTSQYYVYRKLANQDKYQLLAKRKKSAYTDESLTYNKNYRYKIVSVAKRSGYEYKGLSGYKMLYNRKLVDTKHQKYSYENMEEDIKELARKYYGLVHYKVIGKSADGRKIYDVILGNQNASKSLLVVSTLHAREYMASLLCMNQIEHYLEKNQEEIGEMPVRASLNKIAIHYIPMANPDGVTISQYGISKIKSSELRKKLASISNGSVTLWKANARGVDLNRNFPYHFKKSGAAGSQGYSGKSAASEPETQAVVSLVKTLKKKGLAGVVNYHATGSIVFGGCTKKGAVKENTQKMYNLARQITGYADSASYEKDHKGGVGSFREYLVYKQKIPSITLEIGWSSCPGPISEFPAIWERNRTLVFEEAMLFGG